MIKLSVVIPCYNEAKNIPLILEQFKAVITRNDIEVVLVDNGSRDQTPQLLAKILPHYPFAKTVTVDVNQGYGFGILTGLRAAQGTYLGWTHADMQTDPADVIKALNIIEKAGNPANIYVKGNRKLRRLFDQFFTTGMSFFETIYFKKVLWDVNGQPNIFHRSFYEQWQNPPHDFALDLYALYLAKKRNFHVLRFSVFFAQRAHGTSSWNTGFAAKWKLIKRTMSFSKQLKHQLDV